MPQLRHAWASNKLTGEILAIIEEHCLAADNWLATLSAAFSPGYVVVGRTCRFPVTTARLRDWITYFFIRVQLPIFLPGPDGDTFNVGSASRGLP